MSKIYNGLVHLNGNVLVSIDLETTGLQAGYHEPIQIAALPLDADLRPLEGVRPFYTNIRPLYPERAESLTKHVHKLDLNELILHAPEPDRVADRFYEWFQKLDLPQSKNLVPLAHNWSFEFSFLRAWLGFDLQNEMFHGHVRDAMQFASNLNDRAAFRGEPQPFSSLSLTALCELLKIENQNPHDALADAIAEAELYRTMLLL
jgi:DNA polymerase III epsilon subunit-like protein